MMTSSTKMTLVHFNRFIIDDDDDRSRIHLSVVVVIKNQRIGFYQLCLTTFRKERIAPDHF